MELSGWMPAQAGSAGFAVQYTEDFRHGVIEIVVDDPVVELAGRLHLVLGIGHTQGERGVVFGLPAVEPFE